MTVIVTASLTVHLYVRLFAGQFLSSCIFISASLVGSMSLTLSSCLALSHVRVFNLLVRLQWL